MIDFAELKATHSAAAGLKHAAMAGSALALAMGVTGQADAMVITHTLATPIVVSPNTASSNAFDLNGDGITDYTLTSTGGCSPSTSCSISIVPNGGNQVYTDDVTSGITGANQAVMETDFATFESDFYSSGVKATMAPGSAYLAGYGLFGGLPYNGDWANDGQSGVLGLEFQIGGQNYFGYIGGTVSNPNNAGDMSIAFDSYGYDTAPIPEADTLSLLAMGLVGIGALRRRRRKAVKG